MVGWGGVEFGSCEAKSTRDSSEGMTNEGGEGESEKMDVRLTDSGIHRNVNISHELLLIFNPFFFSSKSVSNGQCVELVSLDCFHRV